MPEYTITCSQDFDSISYCYYPDNEDVMYESTYNFQCTKQYQISYIPS